MKQFLFIFLASLGMTILMMSVAEAQTLTLDSYKAQVMEKDPETQAALERKKGAEASQNSAELLTGVNLFGTTTSLEDERPTSNPSFQGTKTKVEGFSFGLQQQTRLGLRWALSQNVTRTHIVGAGAAFVPNPKYDDAYPKLELTMPLWRNLLGRETSGDVDQMKFQARANAKQAEIAWIQRQSTVEEIFYRVLSSQESFDIQKDSLARAERILSWTDNRVKRNLVDASDLYQAQAAVASRKIDMVNAETQLKDVSRTFNSLRGVAGDKVPEKLTGADLDLKRLKLERSAAKLRLDTLAQKDLFESSAALYRAQREKNKPTLDFTVQAYAQGRDYANAAADVNKSNEKVNYVYAGVNLVVPLDQFKASSARSGFASLEKSQKLLEEARVRDEKLTWEETADQADSLAKQVTLLRELETFQKKKADAERDRLNRGRSTTFQVLSFEQDYALIRSQRIQIEFQARQFINSLALFE